MQVYEFPCPACLTKNKIMKPAQFKSFLIITLCTVILSCNEEKPVKEIRNNDHAATGRIAYDSVKAHAYGADDYGMKKYVMAFLKKGPNKSADAETRSQLQNAHLKNITRLAEEGKLVLAGPFFGDGDLRGIYIFNVDNIADAEALTNSDPSIQAGVLTMELKEWYGSAALMAVNDLHHSISKEEIAGDD